MNFINKTKNFLYFGTGDITKVYLYLQERSKAIDNILLAVEPQKLQKLTVHSGVYVKQSNSEKIKDTHMSEDVDSRSSPFYKSFSLYAPKIFKLIPRITKEFGLVRFDLKKQHLEAIINNCQHLEGLRIVDCRVECMNLSLNPKLKFHLKALFFLDCKGKKTCKNWR